MLHLAAVMSICSASCTEVFHAFDFATPVVCELMCYKGTQIFVSEEFFFLNSKDILF